MGSVSLTLFIPLVFPLGALTYSPFQRGALCVSVCVCVCVRVCSLCVCVCVCVYMCTCMRVCVCVCVCEILFSPTHWLSSSSLFFISLSIPLFLLSTSPSLSLSFSLSPLTTPPLILLHPNYSPSHPSPP